MKIRTAAFLAILLLSTLVAAGQTIPPGTILPVKLDSTLDARHAKPGQKITGRIMQDVPLPDRGIIPKRSRITGQVVSARAGSGSDSSLAVTFDRVIIKGKAIPVTTHLRALASMNEVFEAKLPTNSWDDYGTSPSDWNTVQVGGAGVYRGNGEVVSGDQVVGKSTDYGAVTAKLTAPRGSPCHSDDREQALWVFSPWACGTYGFSDLKIAQAGRPDPVGQIELVSARNVHIDGGSGWLLRVEPPSPENKSTSSLSQ
jgi:hypothetical protein